MAEKIKVTKLSELQKRASNLPKCVESNLKAVEGMDKKTYLQYYIKVLESQIKEASKILEQKKKELARLR